MPNLQLPYSNDPTEVRGALVQALQQIDRMAQEAGLNLDDLLAEAQGPAAALPPPPAMPGGGAPMGMPPMGGPPSGAGPSMPGRRIPMGMPPGA